MHSCSPFSSISNTAQVPVGSFRLEAGKLVLDLKKTSDLTTVGGSVKLEFSHPDDGTLTKIVLVHPESISYLAFANKCTHKGKELEYDHETRMLHCVSGHSEFDLSGRVLKGNAESSLKCFPTELEEDTLVVGI
jgi:Rieske Fe-S protein